MYTISPEHFSRRQVNEWRHQVHLHHELMTLPERYLRDIGMIRATEDLRASQPFGLF